jgi:hypothetical protein
MEEVLMKAILLAVLMILLIFTLAFGAVTKVPGGVEFSYYDPSAFSVALAGGFNNWDTQAQAMTKDEEGTWRVVVDLPPGRYEYKFVINGSDWLADPDNPKVVGDYGNSEIEITEDGEPVIRGLTTVISNTPVNARVMITGWFRGTYSARKDALGDVRWRGSRPRHEMYVGVNPTIGSDVKGSATIRLDSGEGDIRDVEADLYAARLAYMSHYFDVTAYHNEEIISFDDPMGVLGGRDLPGTLWDDDIAFGKGTQGLIGDFRVLGMNARAFYTNIYDDDIYNSQVWFDYEGDIYQVASRYDNTDTDVVGVRAKRGFWGMVWGGTFLADRNGWWVGFEEQEAPSAIEEYRAESGDSASTWFEMGTQQRFIAVDVEMEPSEGLSLFGEFAWTRYEASWDAGNRVRKQGDVFVDGKIDVPVGDQEGNRVMAGFEVSAGGFHTGFSYQIEDYDGMDAGEGYVSNYGLPFEDPDSPLLSLYGPLLLNRESYRATYTNVNSNETFVIFEHEGLPERKVRSARLDISGPVLGLALGLNLDITKQEWDYRPLPLQVYGPAQVSSTSGGGHELTYVSLIPSVSGNLFGERLAYDVEYEDSKDNLHPRMPAAYDRNTLLVRGDLSLADQWSIYYNLRRVSYQWSDGGDARDESFFNPHLALVWSPVSRVEIRLGYGVSPIYYIDQAVEGREIGRERWMTSYLWLDAGNSLIDAEEALEDIDMISLMGVIAF